MTPALRPQWWWQPWALAAKSFAPKVIITQQPITSEVVAKIGVLEGDGLLIHMTGDPERFSRFLSTAGDTEGGGLIYVNETSVS